MTIKTCAACRHFDPAKRKPGPDQDDTGMCRFPPPAIQTWPDTQPWPFCKMTDWCSHWLARDA